MTVAELIEFLKTQPQSVQVIYRCFSEKLLMSTDEIKVVEACEPRSDGWVQNKRPDRPSMLYLCFPGN